MPATILVVRHAPPREEGVCYGRREAPVTLEPEDAGRVMLAALGGHRPQRVWTSPASRCREPAGIVARSWSIALTIDERLAELSFGAWEGRSWKTIGRDDGAALDRWMRDWQAERPPGGETVGELERRVTQWLQELDPAVHVLVAHAGVVRALRVLVGGEPWAAAMGRPVPFLEVEAFEA